MTLHPIRALSVALIVVACVACGGAQSASPPPKAATFDEFGAAYCAAWDELFTAVGNPDTGSHSRLSSEFGKAADVGDIASTERLAAMIVGHLESGRGHVAVASGWPSAGPMMAQLDRVFLAYEAMIAARRAGVSHAPGEMNPQAAFEEADGVEAWQAMFPGFPIQRPAGVGDRQCPTVPVGY
jgi:hypothetical protein